MEASMASEMPLMNEKSEASGLPLNNKKGAVLQNTIQ